MKKLAVLLISCLIVAGCSKEKNAPEEPTAVEEETIINGGALPGIFSVSSTRKVQFSMGNLQYNIQTGVWRFAPSQSTILGKDNEKIEEGTIEWMDMFLWGSSGYGNTSPTNGYHEAKNISNSLYDWGVYNKITNGGNTTKMWRTLTASEWEYIINKRPNNFALFTRANVGGLEGWIILPDDWKKPEGVDYQQYVEYKNNMLQKMQSSPTYYNDDQWKKLEKSGAVFLPTTGYLYNMKIGYRLYSDLQYWTSTYVSDYTRAYAFTLNTKIALGQKNIECIDNVSRQIYLPVRLVKNY